MKFASAALAALIATSARASPRKAAQLFANDAGEVDSFFEGPERVSRLQQGVLATFGKVPDVPGAAPRRQQLTTDSKIAGAKRVKIRSGPYAVPSMMSKKKNGKHGGLSNYPDCDIERPCNGKCVLLKQWAGLEYADGKDANIDTGMWLHHMVHLVDGPGRWDATCFGRLSLPHLGAFTLPETADRLFSSGNERTVFDYNPGVNGIANSGFELGDNDKFRYIVDLMNMNTEEKTVYLTMTFDYIEGDLPSGWSNVKSIWLDANQCGSSEVKAPQQTGAFTISSIPWKANFEGTIIDSRGHVHDGGVHVSVTADNKSICASDARYAESPSYIWTGPPMGDDKPARDHISSMTPCAQRDITKLQRGQSVVIAGKYNYDQRAGNIERGKQDNLMAIAIVLVAVPPGPVPTPSSPNR